jgi:DUF2950 family protein
MKNILDAAAGNAHRNGEMNMPRLNLGSALTLACSLVLAMSLWFAAVPAHAQASPQATYASPEEAMQTLVTAAKAKDRSALPTIFGSDYEQLLSGDEVEDSDDLTDFADAVNESAELLKIGDSKYTLVVGKDRYALPIPIVQKDGRWLFDTKAGLDEILNRRIGENELSAISTCRAYAIAQWEYFTEADWDNDGVAEYAQRFISAPGKHDGLYWETAEDQRPSPLGKLIAAARAEGYGPKPGSAGARKAAKDGLETENRAHPRAPYHGYYFKILKGQGSHAPGGKYGYVINGNMIAGYALLAYPDKWGNSGVMSFIINQQGRVYQKNLGPDTVKIGSSATEYDPDSSWKLVEAQP